MNEGSDGTPPPSEVRSKMPGAPPAGEIVPFRRPPSVALDLVGRERLVQSNREISFGFLLGYLSLALHSTLDYAQFIGYYVGPWQEEDGIPDEDSARAWRRSVARRSAYSVERVLGDLIAVISDGEGDPEATFRTLGVPEPDAEPTRRLAVRLRVPRVDLVVAPSPGFAFDLHGFAREVGERFRRNLD